MFIKAVSLAVDGWNSNLLHSHSHPTMIVAHARPFLVEKLEKPVIGRPIVAVRAAEANFMKFKSSRGPGAGHNWRSEGPMKALVTNCDSCDNPLLCKEWFPFGCALIWACRPRADISQREETAPVALPCVKDVKERVRVGHFSR
jgi:hypothetical protein